MTEELTSSQFTSIQDRVREGDTLTVVYNNQNIDDQIRNPLTQTMDVTSIRGSWILGNRTENPSRNRGLGIVSRTYGGEQRVMFVRKNYVRGMRDNHYAGPVLEIKL